MKNIKIHLVLFSFLISIASIAQVPGYLGKRFSIGYSNYFFPRIPAISSSIGFIDGDIPTERSFNSTHCLDMDYTIGSRVSFCMSGQFSKMELLKYGSDLYVQKADKSYTYVYYFPPHRQDMQLNTVNISVGFKFFKSNYLNPVGRYRKWELILIMNKLDMEKNGFYYTMNNQSKPYLLSTVDEQFASVAIAYTIGKQRVLFNKLVLDYGIRFGINYSYVFSDLNIISALVESDSFTYDGSLAGKLKSQANGRTFGAQLVNAHIGLRFLAF
jgi:hypothetical protein